MAHEAGGAPGTRLAALQPRARAAIDEVKAELVAWRSITLPVKELVDEGRGLVKSKQSGAPAQDRCLSSPRGCGCGLKPKHKVGRPGPGSARVVAAAVAASAAAVAARRGAEDAVSAACGRGFREGSRSGLGQPSATWEGREGREGAGGSAAWICAEPPPPPPPPPPACAWASSCAAAAGLSLPCLWSSRRDSAEMKPRCSRVELALPDPVGEHVGQSRAISGNLAGSGRR